MTADPTGQEPNIGDRVDYTRVPPAGHPASGTAGGSRGESWQRQYRRAEEGRWDQLSSGPGRDVDEVVEELLR